MTNYLEKKDVISCHLYMYFNHEKNKIIKEYTKNKKNKNIKECTKNEKSVIEEEQTKIVISEDIHKLFKDKNQVFYSNELDSGLRNNDIFRTKSDNNENIFVLDLKIFAYTFLQNQFQTKKINFIQFKSYLVCFLKDLIFYKNLAFKIEKILVFITMHIDDTEKSFYRNFIMLPMNNENLLTLFNDLINLFIKIDELNIIDQEEDVENLYLYEISDFAEIFFESCYKLLNYNSFEFIDSDIATGEPGKKKPNNTGKQKKSKK